MEQDLEGIIGGSLIVIGGAAVGILFLYCMCRRCRGGGQSDKDDIEMGKRKRKNNKSYNKVHDKQWDKKWEKIKKAEAKRRKKEEKRKHKHYDSDSDDSEDKRKRRRRKNSESSRGSDDAEAKEKKRKEEEEKMQKKLDEKLDEKMDEQIEKMKKMDEKFKKKIDKIIKKKIEKEDKKKKKHSRRDDSDSSSSDNERRHRRRSSHSHHSHSHHSHRHHRSSRSRRSPRRYHGRSPTRRRYDENRDYSYNHRDRYYSKRSVGMQPMATDSAGSLNFISRDRASYNNYWSPSKSGKSIVTKSTAPESLGSWQPTSNQCPAGGSSNYTEVPDHSWSSKSDRSDDVFHSETTESLDESMSRFLVDQLAIYLSNKGGIAGE